MSRAPKWFQEAMLVAMVNELGPERVIAPPGNMKKRRSLFKESPPDPREQGVPYKPPKGVIVAREFDTRPSRFDKRDGHHLNWEGKNRSLRHFIVDEMVAHGTNVVAAQGIYEQAYRNYQTWVTDKPAPVVMPKTPGVAEVMDQLAKLLTNGKLGYRVEPYRAPRKGQQMREAKVSKIKG